MIWFFSFSILHLLFQLVCSFRNHIDIDDFLNSEFKLFPNQTVPLLANLEEDALDRFKAMLENEDVLTNAYENFKRIYGDRRNNVLEGAIQRKQLFKENLIYIFEHNLFTRTKFQSQFEMGINKFVDMHEDEFKRDRLGLDIPMHPTHEEHPVPVFQINQSHPSFQRSLPSYFDWRDEDIITPVKDQEKCGACVMFAMTGALEGHHALCSHKATIPDLSEQFIIDCAIRANGYKNNKGCDGNTFPDTIKFVKDYGITSELLYPYTGEQGKCKFDGMFPVTRVKEVKRVKDNSDDVKWAVMTTGPISVGIWVFKQFMFYKTGVYDSCGHSSTAVGGHAMAITGFKDEGRTHYYVLKNQWGTDWGENGYVRYTSQDPRCGLEKLAYTYEVEC